jgi:hypothetical protein
MSLEKSVERAAQDIVCFALGFYKKGGLDMHRLHSLPMHKIQHAQNPFFGYSYGRKEVWTVLGSRLYTYLQVTQTPAHRKRFLVFSLRSAYSTWIGRS